MTHIPNPTSTTAADPRLTTEVQKGSPASAAVGHDHSVVTLSDDLLRSLIQAAQILLRATKSATNAHGAFAPSPRLALSTDEASAALGVSKDYFDTHVRPELKVVRRGRKILIPANELERWLERSASRVLDDVEGRRL